MIYAVIDTNVLVSALITHNSLSATAKVVRLLLDGEFTPLYEMPCSESYVACRESQLSHLQVVIKPEAGRD